MTRDTRAKLCACGHKGAVHGLVPCGECRRQKRGPCGDCRCPAYRFAGFTTPSRDAMIAWLRDRDAPFTAAALIGAFGISRSYASTLLFRLHRAGQIEKVGRGRYRVLTTKP